MYIPPVLKMPSDRTAQDFIDQYNFGVLVSSGLVGTHLPFVLKREEGAVGTLYGHFARANPHWQAVEGEDVLVIFTGPHAYISPTWYDKAPAVPTWNYAAVHAYGTLHLLTADQTLGCVEELVNTHEPAPAAHSEIITEALKQKLLKGIVGFRIELTRLEGKWKLGQNRTREDQSRVFNTLSESDSLEARALARYMSELDLGTGHD